MAAPFAVERAPTKALLGYRRRKDVEVALLSDYPVKGLVFEAGESLTATAHLVGAACKRLQVVTLCHCNPAEAPEQVKPKCWNLQMSESVPEEIFSSVSLPPFICPSAASCTGDTVG